MKPIKKSAISLIGVEIECGVTSRRALRFDGSFWQEKFDGSVSTYQSGAQSREFVSRPFNPETEWGLFVKALKDFYKANVVEINESMGLHVHFSTPYPDVFATMAFQALLLRRIKKCSLYKNSDIMKRRVRGEIAGPHACDIYTRPTTADNIIRSVQGGGNRYVHVNFRAYFAHKTIEIRVFEAQKTAAGVERCAHLVCSTVERFFKKNANRARVAAAEVCGSERPVRMEV